MFSFLFLLAIGGRKDTIEGAAHVNIPFHLQENSFTDTNTPINIKYRKRSSLETSRNILKNDKKYYSRQEIKKLLSKNNHCCKSKFNSSKETQSYNEFFKNYFNQQNKNKLIINQFRISTLHLFKFRWKNCRQHVQRHNRYYTYLQNNNNSYNNNAVTIRNIAKVTIEQILSRQWIKIFQNRTSEKQCSSLTNKNEESNFYPLKIKNKNNLYSTDSVQLFNQKSTQFASHIENLPNTHVSYLSTAIHEIDQTIYPVK